MIETDVLVIGAGIAGCITALTAAEQGADVIMLHRTDNADQTNTRWAQGGIIYQGEDDSVELLGKDIEEAGVGLTLPAAARALAEDGPRLVRELLVDRFGVDFDRGPDGSLDITREAAHSMPRIIHSKDHTGLAIAKGLWAAIEKQPRIKRFYHHVAVDLLTLSHHSREALDIYRPDTCVGAYVLDCQSGEVKTILARHTVLATGGLGELYLHTTNPPGARGDGIAMAYRAGARMLNLEFIQFHPTALYLPPQRRMLISESMRGEGARLVTRQGEEFMSRYHKKGSLAPRDVVARAIHDEMLASGDACVFLDITHKDANWLRQRFPFIHDECKKLGIDITRQPIPVVPAAHYSCGGVATDLAGHTTLDRLWAVGEVACTGLHGANRLASTSLLEGLVFGWRAAEAIGREMKDGKDLPDMSIDPWKSEVEPSDPALILQDWMTIKYTMWNYVGLARTDKRLKRALQIMRELRDEVDAFYERSQLDDDLLGLRNGVSAALAVLHAASQNHTSRGCHYLANTD